MASVPPFMTACRSVARRALPGAQTYRDGMRGWQAAQGYLGDAAADNHDYWHVILAPRPSHPDAVRGFRPSQRGELEAALTERMVRYVQRWGQAPPFDDVSGVAGSAAKRNAADYRNT